MSTSRNLVSVPGPGSCYSAWTVEWLLVKTNKPIRSARLLWGVFPPQDPVEAECWATFRERKREHNTEHQTNKTDKRIVGSDSWSHSGGQGRASCFLFTSSFVLLCRGPDWNNEEIKTRRFFSNSDSKEEKLCPANRASLKCILDSWCGPDLLSAVPQICLDCLVYLACNSSSELLFRNGEIKRKVES